jgi:hypothetical protein
MQSIIELESAFAGAEEMVKDKIEVINQLKSTPIPILTPLEQRVKELEDGLRNLIFTASKLWDDCKPLQDTDIMKVTHPTIEEAKQLLDATTH